ncbi:hypothetical protein BDA99DRAFT_536817 [Phascolomyces articulosus]|uniref:Uncharacterized protein n=1 Tax=Phascolomyces articulosus TaxID=60185 RepID=A0AAD5PEG5_9FUNG|nr:hypothetical protein BDA99DRAFT_536817 [Phascolomyces articulosus]
MIIASVTLSYISFLITIRISLYRYESFYTLVVLIVLVIKLGSASTTSIPSSSLIIIGKDSPISNVSLIMLLPDLIEGTILLIMLCLLLGLAVIFPSITAIY